MIRRETTRVIPGEAELALVEALRREGLAANRNQVGLFELEAAA